MKTEEEKLQNEGLALYHADKNEEAAAVFSHLIEGHPDNGDYYRARANALSSAERYGEALADYDTALRLMEKAGSVINPGLFNDRGCAYLCKGDRAAAIADFDRAIAGENDEGRAYPLGNKAHALLELKDYAGAAACCTEAIALRPDNALLYANRAKAFLGKGDAAAALADCNEAVKLEPENHYHLRLRATINDALGNGNDAFTDNLTSNLIDMINLANGKE